MPLLSRYEGEYPSSLLRTSFLALARLSPDSNIDSRNLTDSAGGRPYPLSKQGEWVLPSTPSVPLTQRQFILTAVTYYGPIIVDRPNSALSGRSAQLWLSLVWLCSLGSPWRGGAHPCRYVPHRPTLRGREASWSTHDHVTTSPYGKGETASGQEQQR